MVITSDTAAARLKRRRFMPARMRIPRGLAFVWLPSCGFVSFVSFVDERSRCHRTKVSLLRWGGGLSCWAWGKAQHIAPRMADRFASVVAAVVVWCACCALIGGAGAGCGGIGPSTINHDRFDYTEAIATSWKQQMLANIVKLRYGDTPVFLDVASVINQYSLEAAMDLRLTWTEPHITVGDS